MSCSIYKLDDTYTIETLIKWIADGLLIIPIIQRKTVWDPEHGLEYIKFLLKHGHAVIPVIVNRKIYNGKLVYFLYDGNNRCTTIYKFVKDPLSNEWGFLEDIMVNDLRREPGYDKCIEDIFIEMKNTKFTIFELNFNFSIRQDDAPEKVKSIYERRKLLTADQRELFDSVLEKLRAKYKAIKNANSGESRPFTMINVPVGIFDNCSNSEMYDIYKCLNKGTKIMSEQDLLFPMLFSYEITRIDPEIKTVLQKGIDIFYETRNKTYEIQNTEKLDADYKFNLYFCLMGLHCYLNAEFADVILHKETAIEHLPPVFKMFEFIVLDGRQLTEINDSDKDKDKERIPDKERIQEFSTYAKKLIAVMNFLKRIKENINKQFIGKCKLDHLYLRHSTFLACVSYVYNLEHTDILLASCKRVIIYNYLSSFITNVEEKDKVKRKNVLHLDGGGQLRNAHCISTLKASHADNLSALSYNDNRFIDLFNLLLTESIKEDLDPAKKQRRTVSKFYNLVMGIYFNRNISAHHAGNVEEYEVEHIFPYMCSWPVDEKLDINRLGNLVWLPKKLNRSKGKNIIQESQLYKELDAESKRQIHSQFGYPQLEDCRAIWDTASERIISVAAYNEFCARREENYKVSFLKYLF